MNKPASTARPDRLRRWLGLGIGIALSLLLLSIYSPGQSRWLSALLVTGAVIVLSLGIYEFVRRNTPKSNG
jgi:hypothetical protein